MSFTQAEIRLVSEHAADMLDKELEEADIPDKYKRIVRYNTLKAIDRMHIALGIGNYKRFIKLKRRGVYEKESHRD